MRLFSESQDSKTIFDAVIVGTGLSGGLAAKKLTEAGFRILLLDAGPLLSPAAVDNLSWWTRENRRSAARRQPIQAKHPAYWSSNPQLFVDDFDNPYKSETDFIWIRGRQLGGRSLTWGGVTLRFSDHEFLASQRDGFGPSWPIQHADLDPYYAEVEQLLRVQGTIERLEQLPDGVFSQAPELTETERQFKSIVESNWNQRRVIACRGVPRADPDQAGAHPGWAPKTSLHTAIPAAFATKLATLRPDTVVSHLAFGLHGRSVESVACVDRVTKEKFEVRGRITILCASTIESVRIMLNSQDPQHPGGVGNSSGLLGRYLVDHLAVVVSGSVPDSAQLPRHPSGGANGFCIPRFRNIFESERAFVRGYGIWGGMQRGTGIDSSGDAPWFQVAVLEVLPVENNRIERDPTRTDAWGIPTVKVYMRYGENEHAMKHDAIQRMLEMAEAKKLDVASLQVLKPGQYVHELGGARMGRDSKTSVLSPLNRCWDSPNLFVLDGACFATSGWQNPSLTIMAIASRACDHIADLLKSGTHMEAVS
jgi:choline dehydrogenase-like flavoprotein